jgi:phosphoribosylformimino-5-aminoimidazole carboxamide ribotide isomerase
MTSCLCPWGELLKGRSNHKMEIIPAIDLKEGKCVRLYQGDHDQVTVYGNDPARWALNWEQLGAKRIHVVDLEGAVAGEPQNIDAIRRILKAGEMPVQVGGGIRRTKTIDELLRLGVQRVIMGTATVENESLVADACAAFEDAVMIGIDSRDGYVSTRGWKKQTEITTLDLARKVVSLGAKRIICTDISRDGTLTEPNFESIAELVEEIKLPILAAGGISTVAHIQRLKEIGVEGAILGQALYTRDAEARLSLPEALEAAR